MELWLDRVVGAAARRFSTSRVPTPSVGLLGEARTRAAAEARDRHRREALALAERADRGDREAARAYGELAERALAQMRRAVVETARAQGAIEGAAAALHARFGACEATEHMDDPRLDAATRVRVLSHLDAFNAVAGTYRAFFRAMEPLLDPSGTTRVLDLAAGHGGFALEAARIARERSLEVEVTATDLRAEYLALGEGVAAREGLPVRFAVQDALDLSNLGDASHDVVVCTQSLHHFSAASIARMFRAAARVAARGVVLIDGCRSVSGGSMVGAVGLVRYRDRVFAHDAWVSFRRFYAPEEIGLLARLGPEADGVEAKWMRPSHCLVRWRRGRSS